MLSDDPGDNVLEDAVIWEPVYNLSNILFDDWKSYQDKDIGTVSLVARKEQSVLQSISDSGVEGFEKFEKLYKCEIYP